MISVHSSPVGRLGTQDTGGMSVYIRELSRQLGLRGHRVDIFTRAEGGHASGEARCISENVRLIPLELGPGAAAPKNALHPHLARFFESLERFRSRDGRSYDLVHSHYWLSGRVGQWARQAWGCPHLTTFHTLAAVKNLMCGPGTEPDARVAAERELAVACDRIVVASVREHDHLIRHCGAEAERIAVVRCGVDLDRFRPLDRAAARRRLGASPHENLVLYVGRLAPEKGLDRLIRAIARLNHVPALRLIVVGGDGERDTAQRRMAALAGCLGIGGRVAFNGRVEQRELPHFYSAADLLALPSAYESFGMVALEALACGTPVAATRVGAMEELLRTPASGRLCADLRPASLADAIESLLRQRAAAPRRIDAVRRAVLDYGWSQVAADVWEVYADSLADAGDPAPELAAGFHRPRDGRRSCCGCGALTPA
jgi:D-inositol-3-phosphate glycosyltransferase